LGHLWDSAPLPCKTNWKSSNDEAEDSVGYQSGCRLMPSRIAHVTSAWHASPGSAVLHAASRSCPVGALGHGSGHVWRWLSRPWRNAWNSSKVDAALKFAYHCGLCFNPWFIANFTSL